MIDPRRPDFENTPVGRERPAFGYAPDAASPPAVSIVTPFYRGGDVFDQTAESVLRQSFQQWEWLIVDDGAHEPESVAALARVRDSDPRIRVIERSVNGGPGAARNTGVAEARADRIFFLDDDDLIEPTAIEKCFWFLESHPDLGFAASWGVGFGAHEYLWSKGPHSGAALLRDNLMTTHFMVRREVLDSVGGYDESLRDGFEDWEWLIRCAAGARWGSTIPEYLSWYRRRTHHSDRWENYRGDAKLEEFRRLLAERFPELDDEAFPDPTISAAAPYEEVVDTLPCSNPLAKSGRRLLMVLPWLTMGGSDKFNLDVVEQLTRRGWEITIATTLDGDCSWAPEFAHFTPDLFVLGNFLRPTDRPRFLRYLIESRRPDVVMISNSDFGYLLLPYLQAHCPDPAYVDYCHMEQEDWKNGGYPRQSVLYRDSLDRQLVSSEHLKAWMIARGAEPDPIDVVYTNIDCDRWQRDDTARRSLRRSWGVGPQTAVILFAGRLCAQKQPRVLARTIRELARRRSHGSASVREPDFKLVVAGDGEDLEELERYVDSHGLREHVLFRGAVSTGTMSSLMSACDILFLPSQWEGIALSVFEAMAMQLVVVGADVGGQRELVTPDVGILISRASEEVESDRYAELLEALVAERDLRERMGRRARQRVGERFRIDAMADALTNAFDAAIEGPRSRRASLSAAAAGPWATQVVEYLRLGAAADALWSERERWRAGGEAERADPRLESLRAEDQLAAIENSRSWRWLSALDPGWKRRAAQETTGVLESATERAGRRLQRIRSTRAFRVIRAIKSAPGYTWYARYRYGERSVAPWRAAR